MKEVYFSYRNIVREISNGMLLVIAGPSLLDDKALASKTAEHLCEICKRLNIILIFKSAFKRINSAVAQEFTGLGTETALKHLKSIGKLHQIPVQTDVYNELDVFIAAKYADVLQIPAYLFRETSLLEAAGKTGKCVNIRKGMTINGFEMTEAVHKIHRKGGSCIFLTERGTMHGYNDVVMDLRNLMVMLKNNVPVMIDLSNIVASGHPVLSEQDALQTALVLGRASLAAGAAGFIIDAHANPAIARSSAGYCFQVNSLEPVLSELADLKMTLTGKI